MLNKDFHKTRDDIAIATVVCFFIFIGGVMGWFARGITTRDKLLQAVAEEHFNQAQY